jgi:DNA-binding CsgD family transcriptional regulator
MRLRKIDPAEVPVLIASGLSAAEIANAFGCTEGSLRVRCSQLKISLRRASAETVRHGSSISRAPAPVARSSSTAPSGSLRPKRPSKIDPKQISVLLDRGLTSAQIAAEFGCTIGTLRVRCSRLQISLRQPRKPSRAGSLSVLINAHNDSTSPRAIASGRCLLPASSSFLDVALPAGTIGELRQRAAGMGISAASLAASLLETISRDCLYRAVLDVD